jgi:RNA polymerase sigma factor (sigma-70 family)
MANAASAGVTRQIQTLWDAGTVAALDDTELLGRFVHHDAIAEVAFTALVQRYAPMVLRVCRDVTGDAQDAQDAAQATFLILAQRAGLIRRREALANWLFGTARRVAARARRESARRRRLERRYAETIAAGGHSDATGHEPLSDWSGLYEELARLPDRYRIPIVLCDLEGNTHGQAAQTLGCPERTLETRLYRGRERLRHRLIRRGLAPAIAAGPGVLAARAAGPMVPTAWAQSTAVAAMCVLRGESAVTATSANAIRLLRGASRAMSLTRLKWVGAAVLFAGASFALALGFAQPTPATQAPQAPPAIKKTAVASPPSAPLGAPITVTGRATDSSGKSVVGATIYLVSTNGADAPLGTAKSGPNGVFAFNDAQLPICRDRDGNPSQGTLQVYGTAPGRGFAWHGMRAYSPRPRPADRNVAGEDYSLFLGEPIVMDLVFTAPATISGRVLDESARPVSGATIRIDSCDYLDTEHRESHHNFREFWAIHQAPEALTTAKTGPDGRFAFKDLPQEVGFWIHFEHPGYARLSLHAATTSRPTSAFDYPLGRIVGRERPPVATGDLNLTVFATRRIDIRTTVASTGRPAPGMRVSASQGSSASGYSASGLSDAQGKLTLGLPPGAYNILADPTKDGADCIRTKSTFNVAPAPMQQSLELSVNTGCVLVLEAVDSQSGEGIPGLTFWSEMDDNKGSRWQVQTRTGYIDNPSTDKNGRLRAVVPPGAGVFALGYVPESSGYKVTHAEKRATLTAGKTVTIRFELEKAH